jgi:hypothetical protein
MTELTSPQNLPEEKLDLAIYNSIRYLDDVTSMETELGAVYSEAESVLRSARSDLIEGPPPDSESLAQDMTRP